MFREADMSQKIENARALLMKCGKDFLMNNPDGKAGKFNVRDLTARCGMALGTFYHYFDSKDALVRLIVREDWLKALKVMDSVIASGYSLYRKVKLIYGQVLIFEQSYRYSALDLLSQTEENRRFQKECFELLQTKIRDFLAVEVEKNELHLKADPEIAAYLLIQLFSATAKNPEMDFDDLWMCMTFRDNSRQKGR
jgi:AcrR family transcriptional regulator